MLAAWVKGDSVAEGGLTNDGCRNPMATRGQEFDQRMIKAILSQLFKEVDSSKNIITAIGRCLKD